MPSSNIVLTYKCVNRCPYCFSSKTQAKNDETNMNQDEFTFCLDFIKRSEKKSVRLLGGEPFLHPLIEDYIIMVLDDPYFEHITIFTTGFINEKYYDLLSDKKVNLVVNVNHPDDYEGGRFSDLASNLKNLADRPVNFTIGFNIYRENFDYQPIVSMAKRFGCKSLRWTVAVPSAGYDTLYLNREQRAGTGERIIDFLSECVNARIKPVLDCPLEPCIFNETQYKKFSQLCPDSAAELGRCSPVLDFCPGYKVIRCFAAGDLLSVDPQNFKDINQIENYFIKKIDNLRIFAAESECMGCTYLSRGLCMGGCVAGNSRSLVNMMEMNSEISTVLLKCGELYKQKKYAEAIMTLEKYLEKAPLPELIIEYAKALVSYGDFKSFMKVMEKYIDLLNTSGIGSANIIIGKYYEIKGDYISAAGAIRRSLATADEDKKVILRAMIKKLDELIDN